MSYPEDDPAIRIPFRPEIVIGRDPEDNLVCAIASLPEEPPAVGVILADTLRHIANCYWDEEMSSEKAQGIMEIVHIFNAEMSAPTATVKMVTGHGQLAPGELVAEEQEAGS
jgi:hypothetical protein